MVRISCLFILLVSLSIHPAIGQDDPINTPDTLTKPSDSLRQHSPALAATLSAIIPGAGQVYNKKYWKPAIIYAGLGTLFYFFNLNFSEYKQMRSLYLDRLDPCIDPAIQDELYFLSDNTIETLLEQKRKYMEMTVVGGIILYTLNIIDAAVDAHLYTFDVSDDLSLNWQPQLFNYQTLSTGTTAGISIKINF